MTTKVEQASIVESRHVQTTAMAASSAASSAPKISMFAAKSGFVIPKNKLSGSLVPRFRGGKKLGGSDAVSDESTKQVQRKTKWGLDLTQDAAVRKGRALAYQTRVDQISQQLKSGILETGTNQESPLAVQIPDQESSGHQINSEKSEMLELERSEAIGEILKLNPSYKVPPDYKPLLKEAKVPIPIKEYPGYNFIGLIFGPASDTQKRLEKETGAKIQVYGTKADTGEKVEITDGNEIRGAYEELYIRVSADTYEKVDAAIDLIELLVTPVSVNPVAASTTSTPVSGENVNVINQSQGTSTPYKIPSIGVNQGLAQPVMASAQTPAHGQFQPYPGPWFATGQPQTPIYPPSGFIPLPNLSAPLLNNPVQISTPPFNRSNMPSLFGPRPLLAAGFGSLPQNSSVVPPRQQLPVLQRHYMLQVPPFGHTASPRNAPVPAALQPPPAQPNISAPPPFTVNQVTPTGPPAIVRPLMPSVPQPLSRPPSRPLPDRPLAPTGNSTQWSQPRAGTPPSLGPGSMAAMALPMVPPQGQHLAASQPIAVSGAPLSNISAANMASPVTFPSRPSAPESSSTAANCRITSPAFTSVPQPLVGLSPAPSPFLSPPVAPMRPVMGWSAAPNTSPNPVLGSTPVPSSLASTSMLPAPLQSGIPSSVPGSASNFTPIKPPPVTAPKPHPSSSDFTFQPQRPQNPVSQAVPRPGSQPMLPPKPMVQPPLAPQTPSFRPAMHNPIPPPVMKGFPRPQLNNQMNQPQPQAQFSVSFAGNPTPTPTPLRHAAFPNPSPVAPNSPVPQIGPRNFSPVPQMANSAFSFPPRPGNTMQLQQTYPAAATRPQNLLAPNQQFNSNLSTSGKPASSPSGPQQIYDPFSPTSASLMPQQGGISSKVRKQESDPEYEDLMASVGVI